MRIAPIEIIFIYIFILLIFNNMFFLQHAILPLTLLCLALIGLLHLPFCMSQPILPLADVLVTIPVLILTKPVSFVVSELTFLPATIWPFKRTLPIYFIRVPLSFLHLTVFPHLTTRTTHAVIIKITLLRTSIVP